MKCMCRNCVYTRTNGGYMVCLEKCPSPPTPRPLYGPIVWLEVDGKLKKCRVSEDTGAQFQQLTGQISIARRHDQLVEVDALVKERARVASEIVTSGEYEVWQ